MELIKYVNMGVELKLDTMIGKDIKYTDLQKDYKAIFVGLGAHQGYLLRLAGEDAENVFTGTRIVEDLPNDWPTRVLSGLEALSRLSNGALTVTPETLSLSGNTGNPDASTEISALLAGKLGDGAAYDVDVIYQIKLDPVAGLPTPDECEAEIGAIVAAGKINFEPGSATIDASALGTMDDIATILKRCGNLQLVFRHKIARIERCRSTTGSNRR